jgi:RNA polymerase sigma factor (sigma-70 family)
VEREIEDVYRLRYPAFLRVAVAVTADDEAARDAVHDGFVRALRHRRGWRREGPLEGWLWRIVVNEARKRRARDARLVPTSPHELLAESANGRGESGRAAALVAALPERQRLVLFLRYYADLDYAAIAAALEIAPGTVAATLNAAHRKLRAQLKEVERC